MGAVGFRWQVCIMGACICVVIFFFFLFSLFSVDFLDRYTFFPFSLPFPSLFFSFLFR